MIARPVQSESCLPRFQVRQVPAKFLLAIPCRNVGQLAALGTEAGSVPTRSPISKLLIV